MPKLQIYTNMVDTFDKLFNYNILLKCALLAAILLQLVQPNMAASLTLYELHSDTPLGIVRHEVGTLENAGTPQEQFVVTGNRTNRNLPHNGHNFVEEVSYVADENGYRAKVRIYKRPMTGKRIGVIALKSVAG